MGYFVLPMGDDWKEHMRQAKANIELWERSQGCTYLIDFAISCLEKAKEKMPATAAPNGNSDVHSRDR